MIWILFGITIISLYVATLTSILTVELQGEKPLLVVGKKVGKPDNNYFDLREKSLYYSMV